MQDYLLQFFEYEHLPPYLQMVARPFRELAWAIVHGDNVPQSGGVTIGSGIPDNPEREAGLRKLLEAKDCAVRALLFK